MPALAGRPIFGQCISQVTDGKGQDPSDLQENETTQETEDPSVKDRVLYDSTDQDPLFRLE